MNKISLWVIADCIGDLLFSDDMTEKEKLIEKALRLARQAQEAAVRNAHSTRKKEAWNRPGSSPSQYLSCFLINLYYGFDDFICLLDA